MNPLTKNRMAIIVAMQEEARPIIDLLKMVPYDKLGFLPQLGLGVYKTKIEGKKVYLITNGTHPKYGVDRVSTQPAAVTAFTVIEKLKPEIIISAGTAGGFSINAKIGDVYVSDQPFVYFDRVIKLDKYDHYGIGNFDYYSISAPAEIFGIKLGLVATGSSLDPSERDIEELKKLNADVVDMEAAAIAEVAERLGGVKMIAVKSVTNLLNETLHTDFIKNYTHAVQRLAEVIATLVPWLLKA